MNRNGAWPKVLPNSGRAEVRSRFAGGGKSEHHRARCRVTGACGRRIHAGGVAARRADGQCHRKQTARLPRKAGKGEKVG